MLFTYIIKDPSGLILQLQQYNVESETDIIGLHPDFEPVAETRTLEEILSVMPEGHKLCIDTSSGKISSRLETIRVVAV